MREAHAVPGHAVQGLIGLVQLASQAGAGAAFERLLARRVWQKALDKKQVTGEAKGFNLLTLRRVLAAPARSMEMWLRRKLLATLWHVLPTAEWLNQHGWKLALSAAVETLTIKPTGSAAVS